MPGVGGEAGLAAAAGVDFAGTGATVVVDVTAGSGFVVGVEIVVGAEVGDGVGVAMASGLMGVAVGVGGAAGPQAARKRDRVKARPAIRLKCLMGSPYTKPV